MKEKFRLFNENAITVDWVILTIIITFCFVFYQQGDILHTGGSSFNLLNGHIKDFYDYNVNTEFTGNNYLPTTYILFAFWNIPIRLLKIVTEGTMNVGLGVRMWYKLGTTLLYVFTGYLLFKIANYEGYDVKDSLLCSFIFYSSPIAVFSQFIFGQYDIITTFFMVLGYYYYLKNEDWKFVGAFSIAMTCKYFALLIFLPLLLYKEKKIGKIIIKCIGMMGLFIIETLFYIDSPAFRQGVFGFSATSYIFQNVIDLIEVKISIVMLLWVLLCAYSYFEGDKEKKDLFKETVFIMCVVMFITFGLSFWHPQWLIMAIPFFSLAIFMNKHIDIYMYLDTLLMFMYIGFSVNNWVYNVDQTMFYGGILNKYRNSIGVNMQMNRLFVLKDTNLWFSMFASLLLVIVVFVHPRYMINERKSFARNHNAELLFRTIIGNMVFILPSFVCLFINLGII